MTHITQEIIHYQAGELPALDPKNAYRFPMDSEGLPETRAAVRTGEGTVQLIEASIAAEEAAQFRNRWHGFDMETWQGRVSIVEAIKHAKDLDPHQIAQTVTDAAAGDIYLWVVSKEDDQAAPRTARLIGAAMIEGEAVLEVSDMEGAIRALPIENTEVYVQPPATHAV